MENTEQSLYDRALAFASEAHGRIGQVRKYTGVPYIEHPIEVASIVRSTNHTEEMLAAALLHDVVEDTGVTLDVIHDQFGEVVACLVEQLTDVSKPSDGNRAKRKAIDREHTASSSPHAKTIKLADLLSNTRDIVKNDPDFARVYMREKQALLPFLKEGDETLYAQAEAYINSYFTKGSL